MKRYVLGFLFDNDNHVWLINKTKPDWQKGKLNGIGGKVEGKEDLLDAMTREFKEETGITITDWTKFCVISDEEEYQIICYSAYSGQTPQTTTDEVVGKYSVKDLPDNVLFNAYWLISMAKHAEGREYYVTECFKIENHDTREDLDKWVKNLKDEGKVADIKVVDYNEANLLIQPIETPEKIDLEELGLKSCEQCNEQAWDGYICHSCGAKNI